LERETDIEGWKAWKRGRNETKRRKKKRTVAAADEIMKKEGNKGSEPILFFRCAC
jgi:hypothetical protein